MDSENLDSAPDAVAIADAIADLQTRLTYHEDEIQQLNRVLETQRVTLAHQAEQIGALKRLVASLVRGLRGSMGDGAGAGY